MSSIQNQMLEVTVVECAKLKDTEWISRQDPYICLEYGNTKYRTRTCTDGGKTPVFQEKFMFTLIEGLREINVVVFNSNTLTADDFIGSGKIQLQDVLCKGYDDKYWPIHTKAGRYAGEVKLIMHYAQHNTAAVSYGSTPPPYLASSYSAPPPALTPPYTNPGCPPPYLPQSSAYPNPMGYTYTPYPSYPPPQQAYSAYPYPTPDRSIYPPPPEGYPTSTYPPPLHASPYTSPGSYGIYPPPPY